MNCLSVLKEMLVEAVLLGLFLLGSIQLLAHKWAEVRKSLVAAGLMAKPGRRTRDE
jgi:hypothetical protein